MEQTNFIVNKIKSCNFKNYALVVFGIFSFITDLCYGWDGYGHKVIAAIAERYCSADTKNEIAALIGPDKSLRDISNWADEMRENNRITAKWHYVYIPRRENSYAAERDCPKAGCLISAIEHFKETLADDQVSKEKREEALSFIVHLIGDLHQPLHCGYREDNGGNWVKVRFLRRKSNLHKVWDSDIIARNEIGFYDYVNMLEKRMTPERQQELMKGAVVDWVFESRSLLQNYVYDFDSSKKLGSEYYDKALRIVDEQLLKAGIRLAGILDAALASKE